MTADHLSESFRTTAELKAARKASRGTKWSPRSRRCRKGELSGRRSAKKASAVCHQLTPTESQESRSTSRTSPEPSSTSGGSAASLVRAAFAQDRRRIDAELEEGKATLWRRLAESMDGHFPVTSVVGNTTQQDSPKETSDPTLPLKALNDIAARPPRPFLPLPALRQPQSCGPGPTSREKLMALLLADDESDSDSPQGVVEESSPFSSEAIPPVDAVSEAIGMSMIQAADGDDAVEMALSEAATTACPTDPLLEGLDARTCRSAVSPSSRLETASLDSSQLPPLQTADPRALTALASSSQPCGSACAAAAAAGASERGRQLSRGSWGACAAASAACACPSSSSSSWRPPPRARQWIDTSWHHDIDVDLIKNLITWKNSCKLTCMAPGCKNLAVPPDVAIGKYLLKLYGIDHPQHRFCLKCAIYWHQENRLWGMAWKCWLLAQISGIELPLAGFPWLLSDGSVKLALQKSDDHVQH